MRLFLLIFRIRGTRPAAPRARVHGVTHSAASPEGAPPWPSELEAGTQGSCTPRVYCGGRQTLHCVGAGNASDRHVPQQIASQRSHAENDTEPGSASHVRHARTPHSHSVGHQSCNHNCSSSVPSGQLRHSIFVHTQQRLCHDSGWHTSQNTVEQPPHCKPKLPLVPLCQHTGLTCSSQNRRVSTLHSSSPVAWYMEGQIGV